MPTLFGAPVSPFVRKVMVALAEKGIGYEHDPVVPAVAPAEFKRVSKDVSPLGRIPAYRDGDFALADSSVIRAVGCRPERGRASENQTNRCRFVGWTYPPDLDDRFSQR